ncbi:hypothetical protein ACFFRR_007025 [Megaselia abdita]
MFKKIKYFLLFLLIIISYTSAAPPPGNKTDTTASQHDIKKPLITEHEEKTAPQVKEKEDSLKKKEPQVIASAPVEVKPVKTPHEEEKKTPVERFPWLELRKSQAMLERFNESRLLNDTVVPFLKKCDTINNTYVVTSAVGADQELNLCPVYFDALLCLNETSFDINSSELEAFNTEQKGNKRFCEDVFKNNVNATSSKLQYSKDVVDAFSSDMVKACFFWCLEPSPLGQLKKNSSCATIAFMGTKLKKTEVPVDSISTKNQKEDQKEIEEFEQSQMDDRNTEDGDYKDEQDDDFGQSNVKPLLTEDVKQADLQTPEIINQPDAFGNPISPNIVIDEPDPSMKYFAFATFILCVVYFGWHYRSKILGLIVEGRRSQRGRGGGGGRGSRKHTAAYRKLDSNLEEAINSSTSSRSNSQIIY